MPPRQELRNSIGLILEKENLLPRTVVNPDALYDPSNFGFAHAVRSSGQTMLHCSDQTSVDEKGHPMAEGDLAAQARQALGNLKTLLADQGAGPEHLAMLRAYVVDYDLSKNGSRGWRAGGVLW